MTCIMPSRCSRSGCSRTPSYGIAGTSKRIFCGADATEASKVNVSRKECAQRGFTKISSFGMAGTKRDFCRGYAKEGMIDLVNNKCAHNACNKAPSCGDAGTKKREFCREHAKDGMVDLVNKKCVHQGCSKIPSFGVAGTKKVEFCSENATEGMINVQSKKCAQQGRNKSRSCGVAGTRSENPRKGWWASPTRSAHTKVASSLRRWACRGPRNHISAENMPRKG